MQGLTPVPVIKKVIGFPCVHPGSLHHWHLALENMSGVL